MRWGRGHERPARRAVGPGPQLERRRAFRAEASSARERHRVELQAKADSVAEVLSALKDEEAARADAEAAAAAAMAHAERHKVAAAASEEATEAAETARSAAERALDAARHEAALASAAMLGQGRRRATPRLAAR